MNITEVLISYYTKAIEEHKAESKKIEAKAKPKSKKIEKTDESVAIMPTTKPAKTPTIPKPAIVSPVLESDDVLEAPIFGLTSEDKSWLEELRTLSPAAYQNLKNWE